MKSLAPALSHKHMILSNEKHRGLRPGDRECWRFYPCDSSSDDNWSHSRVKIEPDTACGRAAKWNEVCVQTKSEVCNQADGNGLLLCWKKLKFAPRTPQLRSSLERDKWRLWKHFFCIVTNLKRISIAFISKLKSGCSVRLFFAVANNQRTQWPVTILSDLFWFQRKIAVSNYMSPVFWKT